MVLLKSVVEVITHPMLHLPTELDPDRSGIGVMAVCRDPRRHDAGHHLGRSKKCLGGRQVAMLAQHDVDQGAVAIDRAIQIPQLVSLNCFVQFRQRNRRLPCAVRSGRSWTAVDRTPGNAPRFTPSTLKIVAITSRDQQPPGPIADSPLRTSIRC